MAKLCDQRWVIDLRPTAEASSLVATENVATQARRSSSFRIFLFCGLKVFDRSMANWVSVANAACSSRRFRWRCERAGSCI